MIHMTLSPTTDKLSATSSNLQPTKAFTLIELVLYVGISSVMLLIISVFLSTLLESRVKNQTIAEVEQQGLQTVQIITQTLRNADSILSPAQGASAPSLSLNTYTGANNPTVFDLASGTLRIAEGASAAVTLTNSRVTASGLNFYNLSRSATPGTIQMQFTITLNNPEGRNEYNYSKMFSASATLRQP